MTCQIHNIVRSASKKPNVSGLNWQYFDFVKRKSWHCIFWCFSVIWVITQISVLNVLQKVMFSIADRTWAVDCSLCEKIDWFGCEGTCVTAAEFSSRLFIEQWTFVNRGERNATKQDWELKMAQVAKRPENKHHQEQYDSALTCAGDTICAIRDDHIFAPYTSSVVFAENCRNKIRIAPDQFCTGSVFRRDTVVVTKEMSVRNGYGVWSKVSKQWTMCCQGNIHVRKNGGHRSVSGFVWLK